MRKRLFSALAVTAVLMAAAALTIYASGTAEDPLISLSYLNSVLVPQLEQKVDERVKTAMQNELGDAVTDAVEQSLGALGEGGISLPTSGGSYAAVQLLEGQTLTAADGSVEVLLRRGQFHSVDPDKEGITNVTKGAEVQGTAELTLQNLYLIPRSDARGIVCDTQEGWVMVRGSYSISGGVNAPEPAPQESEQQEPATEETSGEGDEDGTLAVD